MSDDDRGLRFGSVAELYDEHRPDPPAAAAALLAGVSGRRVLDVGAGTGKLTRFLLGLGAEVSVIEPDEDMRAVLLRRSPGVDVLFGRAESVPAPDATFDAVLSSSAWHWFRQPDATNEFARVLRDDGRLYVLWNGHSSRVEWMAALTQLRNSADDPGTRPRGSRAEFAADGPFVDVEHFEIPWSWRRSVDQVVAQFGTYSGAIVQSEEQRATMRARVREALVARFGDSPVEVPMALRGTTARRRPREQTPPVPSAG